MKLIGEFAIPTVVVLIILFGLFKGINVFDVFMQGAKSGIKTAFGILPSLVGLVMAVSMLRESGALDIIVWLMSPLAKLTGIPEEVMPLITLNPISGGGALTMYENLLKTMGPDSFAGRVASVMMGSTETTFYAITVYYGSVGIKKTRHTIPAAVCADLTSYIASSWIVRMFFGR